MKKIELTTKWEPLGAQWQGNPTTTNVICIEKKRGRLTLEEIKDVLRKEYGCGHYMLFLDAREEDEPQYCEEAPKGDYVELVERDEVKF